MNQPLARPVVAFVSQARGVTYTQRVLHGAQACVDLGFDVVCLPPVDVDEPIPIGALRAALGGREVKAVVFHRVVDSPSLALALRDCRRIGAPAIYDVDDLVFDRDFASLFAHLGRGSYAELSCQADRARGAVTQFEYAWAATPALVDALQASGVDDVSLVRNSFTVAQRRMAMKANRRRSGRSKVVIGYGSGSGTHSNDLALIAEPLASVLGRLPHVHFRFIGREPLPPRLARASTQVRQIAPVEYGDLPLLMAQWDISLAPVAPRPFNEAKSELKFIDASLVGVPTIASPRRVMKEAIEHRRTGLHAATAGQWRQLLFDLIGDPAYRTLLGARARREVLEHYGPEARAAAVAEGLGIVPAELMM